MSRWNRRDRRSHKRLDTGHLKLSVMPRRTAAAFDPIETILRTIETTGDIDAAGDTPIFKTPWSHEWFELAPSLHGFVDVYDLHAQISGREMPTGPLRQLANKFKYGVMIFPSDIDLVRESLQILRVETMSMTLNYVDTLIQSIKEVA